MNIKVLFCVFFICSVCHASSNSEYSETDRIGSPAAESPLKTLEQQKASKKTVSSKSQVERAIDRLTEWSNKDKESIYRLELKVGSLEDDVRADYDDIKRLYSTGQDRDKKMRELERVVNKLHDTVEKLRTELGKRTRDDDSDERNNKEKKLDDIQE